MGSDAMHVVPVHNPPRERRVLVLTQDGALLDRLRREGPAGGYTLLAASTQVEALVQAYAGDPAEILLDGRVGADRTLFPQRVLLRTLGDRESAPDADEAVRLAARRAGSARAAAGLLAWPAPARLLLFAVPIVAVTLLAISHIAQGLPVASLPPRLGFWAAMFLLCGALSRLRDARVQREGLLFANLVAVLAAAPAMGLRLAAA